MPTYEVKTATPNNIQRTEISARMSELTTFWPSVYFEPKLI
jgi:hypothetical protein